jgi:hypothetical protein
MEKNRYGNVFEKTIRFGDRVCMRVKAVKLPIVELSNGIIHFWENQITSI